MMLQAALYALALASVASANATANNFIDQVFRDMRYQVSQNGLDPVRVAPFQIKVNSNSISKPEVKVNFTQGSMYGLASLARQGDCSYGTSGDQMKMGCYITLTPVQIKMNADVKGDSSDENKHAIATTTTVARKTLAFVEVAGRRFAQPIVDRITVKAVILKTSVVEGKLNLKGSRKTDFQKQTNQNLHNQLNAKLSGSYKAALNMVIRNRKMP